MELRPYQQECVNDVRFSIQTGKKRVCVVLGCGGGKSVIIAEIAKLATEKMNRVLFLVHRKELTAQIDQTFAAHGVNLGYCDIAMMQTASRHLKRFEKPSMIIIDEAHHSLSNSYMKIIENFPESCIVGFTATPMRMNEGGLGKVFNKLVTSVSTRWLIENGYLADFKYFGQTLADASGLHTKNGDFDKQEVETLMNKDVIFGDTVKNWQEKAAGKKTIVYCSSIETSKNTASAFMAAGISAAHLDGTTPAKERDATVQAFRDGKIMVLSNVDLFSEGFDIPDCEAVVLLRPTKSLTLHIQQSMRSMRIDPKNPDKVALILDHVGNFTRHGLPDMEHEWTLETKKKKEKALIAVKVCPACYGVIQASKKTCPLCDHEFTAESKREYGFIDGQLQEISREEMELAVLAKLPYSACENCKTFEELEKFAKARGYNRYWACYRAMEMKIPIPNKYYWWKLNYWNRNRRRMAVE